MGVNISVVALPIVDTSYIKAERNNWYNIAHLAHKFTVCNPLPESLNYI